VPAKEKKDKGKVMQGKRKIEHANVPRNRWHNFYFSSQANMKKVHQQVHH